MQEAIMREVAGVEQASLSEQIFQEKSVSNYVVRVLKDTYRMELCECNVFFQGT
jgi:hypothetical protein